MVEPPQDGVSMFMALAPDRGSHELVPGSHRRWRTPEERAVLRPLGFDWTKPVTGRPRGVTTRLVFLQSFLVFFKLKSRACLGKSITRRSYVLKQQTHQIKRCFCRALPARPSHPTLLWRRGAFGAGAGPNPKRRQHPPWPNARQHRAAHTRLELVARPTCSRGGGSGERRAYC
eukprot:COSAG06_NODE_2862_length_6156_cov_37.661165_4_plen_174_part_00